MTQNGFTIKKGTNISGVFIDPYLSERDRNQYFNLPDIKYICRFGLDHIRIPISEEIMWSTKGKQISKSFERLEKAIGESIENGLNVILCVHSLRAHPIFGKGIPVLFIDEGHKEDFLRKWLELSNLFRHFLNKNLAYELLNEPRAPIDNDWNAVLRRIYVSLREKEPERTLLFGSNFYQVPERIKTLFLPENDGNIIRTFHLYYPMLFTHYKASWLKSGIYKGPVRYPGRPIPSDYLDSLPEPLGSHMGQNNSPVTKNVFAKILRNASRMVGETAHPLHCGEFGCIDTVPIDARRRWYSDVRGCLEQEKIPWTHWDWKGNFGILNKNTWKASSVHLSMGLRNPVWGGIQRPHLSLRSKVRRRLGRIARKLGLRRSR